MTARLFRLFEIHQRIDERMRRLAAHRGVPPSKGEQVDLDRLMAMKLRAKALIHRLTPRPLAG